MSDTNVIMDMFNNMCYYLRMAVQELLSVMIVEVAITLRMIVAFNLTNSLISVKDLFNSSPPIPNTMCNIFLYIHT